MTLLHLLFLATAVTGIVFVASAMLVVPPATLAIVARATELAAPRILTVPRPEIEKMYSYRTATQVDCIVRLPSLNSHLQSHVKQHGYSKVF